MTVSRKEAHKRLMEAVCHAIAGDNKPLVLKGGTALLLCYGLDRFSEDLDFDLEHPITTHMNVKSLCLEAVKLVNKRGLGARLARFSEPKKTSTTHRCRPVFRIAGQAADFPIRIEISSRQAPAVEDVAVVEGIKVYVPDCIARHKLVASVKNPENQFRTAARDLHDLAFIASHLESELSGAVIKDLEAFFSDPPALLLRYEDAYEDDGILQGRLYRDLDLIETWMRDRKRNNLALFRSGRFHPEK